MENKMLFSNGSGRENESEIDVYDLIRSAEVRDYYRRENVCDNMEKKMILIQNGYISVQQKAAMLRQISGTGTVEENRLAEEMCLIYNQYIDMIYHPSVRTLFVVESTTMWWDAGRLDYNLHLDSVYESMDEVIAQMEELFVRDRERARARVTVLHIPPDEKVKEVFQFDLFWIEGKWDIKYFSVNDDELRLQGISDDAIGFFKCEYSYWYHPLPFENGCRLKFRLSFMDEPVYGTLESELDGNECWYHFLYLDEVDVEIGGLVALTDAEIELGSGYSSLDWIERA